MGSVREDDLIGCFLPYGIVTDVRLSDKQSSAGQVQAYVKFTHRAEAELALSASLNRQVLVKGKTITCRWAERDIESVEDPALGVLSSPGSGALSNASAL